MLILIGAFVGIAWGFLFAETKVSEPRVILQQLMLKDFTMLKVMASAIVTSGIIVWIFHFSMDVKPLVKILDLYPNLFGGIFMGIGIALTGACPGTTWAQIGAGYKNAWLILLGGLTGVIVYGLFLPEMETFFRSNPGGPVSLIL